MAENKIKDLRVLSLFSGCGGMDLGFEGGFKVRSRCVNEMTSKGFVYDRTDSGFIVLKKTRFKTVFANDILPEAKTAWSRFFNKTFDVDGDEIYHVGSIVDLVKRHESGEHVFPCDIDVVTGGFPCQDFSVAGKRRGFKSRKNHLGEYVNDLDDCTMETRGMLYYWMKRVIDITRPKVFIAENVKGLTNLDNVIDIIHHDFSSANGNGYIVLPPRVLHATDYGVPQNRERVIFIGIRVDALNDGVLDILKQGNAMPREWNPYPVPTHSHNWIGNDNIPLADKTTCRDVIGYLPEPEESPDLSQQSHARCKFMGKHCQGNKEINMNGIAPTIRSEHHGNIEFRRLSFEHGGMNNEELNSGLQERRLTVRECGLLQTFPPDYEFVIPKTSNCGVSVSMAYKIIGNAVPPLMAYNIAKRLESLWDKYFRT